MKRPYRADPDLSYWEYRSLLELMMVSDPFPLNETRRRFVVNLLDREAEERGYDDWIQAYHSI